MTFEDFKDVYGKKSAKEKLMLVPIQIKTLLNDEHSIVDAAWLENQEDMKCWRNEAEEIKKRIEWLLNEIGKAIEGEQRQ